jgi:hypothetical protein
VYRSFKLSPVPDNIDRVSDLKTLRGKVFKSFKGYTVNEKHFNLMLMSLLILKPDSLGVLNGYLLSANFDSKINFLEKNRKGIRVLMPVFFEYTFEYAYNRYKFLWKMQDALLENLDLSAGSNSVSEPSWMDLFYSCSCPEIKKKMLSELNQELSFNSKNRF